MLKYDIAHVVNIPPERIDRVRFNEKRHLYTIDLHNGKSVEISKESIAMFGGGSSSNVYTVNTPITTSTINTTTANSTYTTYQGGNPAITYPNTTYPSTSSGYPSTIQPDLSNLVTKDDLENMKQEIVQEVCTFLEMWLNEREDGR